MQRLLISLTSLVAFAASANAQPATDAQPQPEPAPARPADQPAPPPAAEPAPAPAPPAPSPPPVEKPAALKAGPGAVTSKWDATLYGFVEDDNIYDSTESFNDNAGNGAVARQGTFTGQHGRTTMSARNSRIGFRVNPPVTESGIKATGQLEMDFIGNQPANPPGISESAFFASPGFRIRHMNLKLETPVVDVLIGQYWALFGWATAFHPASVQIQGLPGQIFSRSAQIRISKHIPAGPASVDIAVAAVRPSQRDSTLPDAQAGLKINIDSLKAWHTAGGAGSSLDSAAIGVSVLGRKFEVEEFSATPVNTTNRNGYGLSIDALVPVVPATKDSHELAVTLTGSYVVGAGTADLYSGLSGGVSQTATLPIPAGKTTAPAFTANIDNGLALYVADGTLHPIQWTSTIVGAQIYLPPAGKIWLAGNYSHTTSDNAHAFGAAAKVFDKMDWADGNVFFDVSPAVRLGFELAWTDQTYVDKTEGINYRAQLSGWLIF